MDQFPKDPDAKLEFGFDYTDWLAGDTVATSTWDVPAGLTGADDSILTGSRETQIWLSGGTDGQSYVVTNHIVTASGREQDRSFTILVGESSTVETTAVPTDAELVAAIDAEIAANPGGITEYEFQDERRVKRMSLKELLEARAVIEARNYRRTEGMFAGARVNRPS